MAMCEIAVKFDEDERASIRDNADAAGMSFSEFVRRAALEKAEDMADTEAYNEALGGVRLIAGSRLSMAFIRLSTGMKRLTR